MRILFISHSYPPIVGGVETQNYHLARGLEQAARVRIVANGRGKKWLPVFLPVTLLKTLVLMASSDYCLLGNGVLAPLGRVLKWFYPHKKCFCVVHGLDITYAHRPGVLPSVYRRVNLPSLRRLDRLIMVGHATLEAAVAAGIERQRCAFIPNGVSPDVLVERHDRGELSRLLGDSVEGKQVILRLARFVPHKGTSWFIENVMPRLPEHVALIAAGSRPAKNVAGDRDDFVNCEAAIARHHLADRVKLLTFLPWDEVKVLLNTVDVVISPNIRVPGSMEGFGLNVIEAGACGRLVVASNLEGLADAVKEGENGFLVEPGDADAWVQKISAVLRLDDGARRDLGQRAAEYVRRHFSWDEICARYLEVMSGA